LAHAPHAGQHVALGDAVGGERVLQRRHHGVLADQVVEGGRTILARQHDVGGCLVGPLAVGRGLGGWCFLLCHAWSLCTPTSAPRRRGPKSPSFTGSEDAGHHRWAARAPKYIERPCGDVAWVPASAGMTFSLGRRAHNPRSARPVGGWTTTRIWL